MPQSPAIELRLPPDDDELLLNLTRTAEAIGMTPDSLRRRIERGQFIPSRLIASRSYWTAAAVRRWMLGES